MTDRIFTSGSVTFFRSILFRMTLVGVTIAFVPQAFYLQNPRSGDGSEGSEIRKRFRLTSNEYARIKPIFLSESEDIVRLYARFSQGDRPEYSTQVWRELLIRRIEFEARLDRNLSLRQRSAIRKYRVNMEGEMVQRLIRDFVSFLGDVLELEEWEMDALDGLFVKESRQKFSALNYRFPNRQRINDAMEGISRITERDVRKLLTDDRWNDYCSILEFHPLIA